MRQASVRAHAITALCKAIGLRGVTAPDLELLAKRALSSRLGATQLDVPRSDAGAGDGSAVADDCRA